MPDKNEKVWHSVIIALVGGQAYQFVLNEAQLTDEAFRDEIVLAAARASRPHTSGAIYAMDAD